MEYLCILNAFEQTYYNRIKEIERVAAATAASNHRHNGLRNSSSINSPSSSRSSSSRSSSSSSNSSPPNHLNVGHSYHHHPHQHTATHSHLNGHNNATNVANSLLWQPWRDFTSSAAVAAAAAAHHHFYQQQQHQHHQQQIHQQNQQHSLHKESRLTAKELPTTKWRRDRRLRAASEYQHSLSSSQNSPSMVVTSPPASPPMMVQPPTLRPLCESTNRTPLPIIESPIDMSVTSTTMKPRASPPPPYREPLPGSTFATTLARPSVITQAPPKRGDSRDSILISNRENDNQSTESISMCETVIDEHFRRSLGPDYIALFGKKSPVPSTPSPTPTPTPPPVPASSAPQQHVPLTSVTPTLHQQTVEHHLSSPTPPLQPPPTVAAVVLPQVMPQALTTRPTIAMSPVNSPQQPAPARVESPPAPIALTQQNDNSSTSSTTTTVSVSSPLLTPSVDDHFAKALGDTWKKLQADKEQRN